MQGRKYGVDKAFFHGQKYQYRHVLLHHELTVVHHARPFFRERDRHFLNSSPLHEN